MLQPKVIQTVPARSESKEEKQKRLDAQKAHKADRQDKLERTRYKGVKDDIELANIFLQFGISLLDYTKVEGGREKAFSLVRQNMQGRRAELVSQKAIEFLVDEFDAEVVVDENNRTVINFPQMISQEEDSMSLIAEIAEKSGHKRKVVKEVYDALLSRIRVHLKTESRIRLPNFCRLKVSLRAAKEKRKGINPFTGKKQWFKARAASNRLRIAPLKAMKEYVLEKLPLVAAPKKKAKKGKKSKK